MPKTKTHSSAAKRFKITKTGKLKHKKAFHGHLLGKKSSRRKRRLTAEGTTTGGDKKITKRLLKI